MRIPFVRLDGSLEAIFRAHATDAGTDLFSLADVPLAPGETARIPINMAVGLVDGYFGLLTGRSSAAARGLLVHLGTVDQGYRGPLFVAVTNVSAEPQEVKRGERIAQLVVLPFTLPQFVEVEALDATERGERGWGSSGR